MTKFVSSNWFAAKSVEQMRVEQSQFEQFTPTRHDGSYRNQFFSRDFEGHREDFGQEKVVLDRGRSEHFNRALSPDGGLRCCFPAWLLWVQAKSEIHSGREPAMISGNPIQSNFHDWWHLSPFVNVKLLPWSKTVSFNSCFVSTILSTNILTD